MRRPAFHKVRETDENEGLLSCLEAAAEHLPVVFFLRSRKRKESAAHGRERKERKKKRRES